MFHTRPGKSYRALNANCTVHGTAVTTRCHGGLDEEEDTLNADETDETDEADERNIVILPFPFDLEGGSPYYEDDESRFKHRPFFNGTPKEVQAEDHLSLHLSLF